MTNQLEKTSDQPPTNGLHNDEFLVMLAHELRNPMASIGNALEIWKSDDAGAEEENEAQLIMARQLQKMVQIVDDLLDVSGVTRGDMILEKEPVNLLQVVNYAVENARQDLALRKQEISLSLPKEAVFVKGDAVRLKQVMNNLLANASKYTELRGHIAVALECHAGTATIRVTDDGVGISPEFLQNVFSFDHFVQSKKSLDRQQGGLGLGLLLVRRLVEFHGGTVEAKSAGLKKGSEFIVRLPIIMSVVEAALPAAFPLPPKKAPASPLRILLVEDNADSATTTQIFLALQGHKVHVAASGPAGVEAALSFKPEVIILDIGLPGMNGYEVSKQIRKLPETKDVLLIALSGYGQAEDIQKAKEAGFDHHLVKPADPNQLLALVSGVSARKQL